MQTPGGCRGLCWALPAQNEGESIPFHGQGAPWSLGFQCSQEMSLFRVTLAVELPSLIQRVGAGAAVPLWAPGCRGGLGAQQAALCPKPWARGILAWLHRGLLRPPVLFSALSKQPSISPAALAGLPACPPPPANPAIKPSNPNRLGQSNTAAVRTTLCVWFPFIADLFPLGHHLCCCSLLGSASWEHPAFTFLQKGALGDCNFIVRVN